MGCHNDFNDVPKHWCVILNTANHNSPFPVGCSIDDGRHHPGLQGNGVAIYMFTLMMADTTLYTHKITRKWGCDIYVAKINKTNT